MFKFAVLLVALIVSIHHASSFPFVGHNFNMYPNHLDTPDDDEVVARGGQGAAGQQGQTGTSMAPPVSPGDKDSDSSSSSSEEGSVVGGTGGGTTAPPAGPIQGAGGQQAGGAGGEAGAGDSSNGHGDVGAAQGGPMVQPQNAGDTSVQQAAPGPANPLNVKPQAIKDKEATQSEAAIAVTTLGLVAGVAALSVVAYKYKDAIRARVGL